MLNADIDKLEIAKKELDNIAIKAENAMRKLDRIVNEIERLEDEAEIEII